MQLLSAAAANQAGIVNDDARMQRAEEVKERANTAYKEAKYAEAVELFKEAHSHAQSLSQHT